MNIIGNKIGEGYQGEIFEFLPNSNYVIKIPKKLDQINENEIMVAKFAGDVGVGPKTYFLKEPFGIVMEKVIPYQPEKEDCDNIIKLFKKCFKHGIISGDSEFGIKVKKNGNKKWLLIDFGVSYILNRKRKESIFNFMKRVYNEYEKGDFFSLLPDFYPGLECVDQYFINYFKKRKINWRKHSKLKRRSKKKYKIKII